MIKEINIKEDFPPVDVAVANVEREIEVNKQFGDNIIKIIHGYGSHGVGGLIKIEVRKRLEELKRQRVIVDYIAGERFTETIIKSLKVGDKIKDILLTDYAVNSFNSGMTVIIIKN